MTYILRFIFGYVKFEFTGGFCEGFINACYRDAVEIRNLGTDGPVLYGSCTAGTYKKLHKIAYANGGRVRVIKKSGLPFILHGLKNRFGFAVGAVIFIFILSFLGSFVWSVELVGNSAVSDTALYSYLENNRLRTGVMWSSVDRDSLSWQMMADFDELSWVHINKIGTTARVEVNERTPEPTPDTDRLEGKNVFRKELESAAYRTQSKITVKSRKDYITLRFFNLSIPLYIKEDGGDIEQLDKKLVTVNGVSLPIGFTKKTQIKLSSAEYDLTDGELESLALKKLEYLKEQELDGYEIINETVKTDIQGDICTAKGAYIVRRK